MRTTATRWDKKDRYNPPRNEGLFTKFTESSITQLTDTLVQLVSRDGYETRECWDLR